MALGTAVHDSDCKPDNKNVNLEDETVKKSVSENDKSAGWFQSNICNC